MGFQSNIRAPCHFNLSSHSGCQMLNNQNRKSWTFFYLSLFSVQAPFFSFLIIFTLSFLPISGFVLPVLVLILASATHTLFEYAYHARGMEMYTHYNFVQTSKARLSKEKLESRWGAAIFTAFFGPLEILKEPWWCQSMVPASGYENRNRQF